MLASHNSAILESERLKKGKVDLCRDNLHVEELQKKRHIWCCQETWQLDSEWKEKVSFIVDST